MEGRPEFLEKTAFARKLRKEATPAEKAVWYKVRNEQLGFRFRRQVPIGRRFADICCPQCRVIIEIDGASHDDKAEDDEIRDQFFREQGYVVVRFTNQEVLTRIEDVVAEIRKTCESRPKFRY